MLLLAGCTNPSHLFGFLRIEEHHEPALIANYPPLAGLNIHMPISFLEQNSPLTGDPKLKGRLFAREFASLRYGVFKESGFRTDDAYPPFASLPGLPAGSGHLKKASLLTAEVSSSSNETSQAESNIRGFDENWNECTFDTYPQSGLPTPQASHCAPYLTRTRNSTLSFNLMSSDPFAYADLRHRTISQQPVYWRDLADLAKWHFCGENFPISQPTENSNGSKQVVKMGIQQQQTSNAPAFKHNQHAVNKQNKMCQERSALDVIRSSDDFKRAPFSPSTFNRLPAPNFKFLQEMPPRLVLAVEFGVHLYQSRRLDHGILEAAIAKLLAFDLIVDSEVSLILFGQQHSRRMPFMRLDGKLDPTLYTPPIDPFDEPAKLFSELELQQMSIGASNSAKIIKGSCSFQKLWSEVGAALGQRSQYDDLGADIFILTSGLFMEDETKIEDIIRNTQHSAQQGGVGYKLQAEHMQINLIIYPSTMLFDTRSRDGYIVLDSIESEAIIRHRVNKLLLIQRLLPGTKVHLVREHLDSNGDVKMSTLLQFHQIFEQITRGHSWDQTQSMLTLSQQLVESHHIGNHNNHLHSSNGSCCKLSFQFEVDSSVQNELIVGFIDPKHHSQSKTGKRFALKNLQLRSPNGQLIFADSQPWIYGPLAGTSPGGANLAAESLSGELGAMEDNGQTPQSGAVSTESAWFPYRSQLSLAGFYLKASHLAQLNATHQLAGTWTLTASADEPVQTSGVAMARANPTGDTTMANCWIQTYYHDSGNQLASEHTDIQETNSPIGQLRQVKVFMQVKSGVHMGQVQEVNARMEVQDELGNIVQNVNMLDDGIGAPDMTKGDGIYTQYVQRAYRPGFYKVQVELTGSDAADSFTSSRGRAASRQPNSSYHHVMTTSGQDNACCGSFVPKTSQQPDTRHLSRQLYCGTFHVEPNNNALAQQRPPRVNNLTVTNVDQDNRRVTIRWYEPSLDISIRGQMAVPRPLSELDEASNSEPLGEPMALTSKETAASVGGNRRLVPRQTGETGSDFESRAAAELAFDRISASQAQQMRANQIRGLIVVPSGSKGAAVDQLQQNALSGRYEIKLFSDREVMRRAFDAKQEIGFKFNEWNVEGTFPNASAYGGMKEVTLRIPYGREGIYFIALKVYNNLGFGSQMSNIVQFYIRNNLTADEADSMYGPNGQATSVDADGNVYDKNGELISRSSGGSYSLLKGAPLDGYSALLIFSLLALVSSVCCIALTCMASSARKSLLASSKRKVKSESDKLKKVTSGSVQIIGAGSGSSMVSSGCGSSQQSEIASSAGSGNSDCGGGMGGHDVDISKLALGEELNYGNLQMQHSQQQQQANVIQSQMMISQQQQSGNPYARQPAAWPQHTLINGYAYATVNNAKAEVDMNQGAHGLPMSPVQSWPADILISHYDKVKQARERNEAPPVMRIETMGNESQFSEGLPVVDASAQQQAAEQSYLVRQHSNPAANYLNQQLHQQLTSVLKSKQQWNRTSDNDLDKTSSPALDGVTDMLTESELMAISAYSGNNTQIDAPLPPQYVYCEDNGLGQPVGSQQQLLGVEPTIYSQVTNLQQVAPTSSSDQMSTSGASYYANQWSMTPGPIYASSNQYQPPDSGLPSQTQAGASHKTSSNSAISEV